MPQATGQRNGTADAATDDAWLDEFEDHPDNHGARAFVADTFVGPLRWVRRMIDFALTTPGQLISILFILTLVSFLAGNSMSQASVKRQQSLDVLINSTEPMSNSAHVLYSSLSQADTVATTSFVSPGVISEEDLKLYFDSLDRGIVAANQILAGTVDSGTQRDKTQRDEIREIVSRIQRDIPLYSGVMERAKANQRLGNPVGAAYMSEASVIMRERMLADASLLFELTRTRVDDDMKRLSAPQWFPLSGLVIALVFLVLAQWWLWRVFRRRLNKGFMVATLLIVCAIIWVSVSNFLAWHSGEVGFDQAAQPWEKLTSARIETQELRTNEVLSLLRRQPAEETDSTFEQARDRVEEAFEIASLSSDTPPSPDTSSIESGRDALEKWDKYHEELTAAVDQGRFDDAIGILSNTEQGTHSLTQAYAQLDSALSEQIQVSRGNMRGSINASLDATRAVASVVFALTLASIAAMWLGARRRLGEYL